MRCDASVEQFREANGGLQRDNWTFVRLAVLDQIVFCFCHAARTEQCKRYMLLCIKTNANSERVGSLASIGMTRYENLVSRLHDGAQIMIDGGKGTEVLN